MTCHRQLPDRLVPIDLPPGTPIAAEAELDWAGEVALLTEATRQLIDAARHQGMPYDVLPV